MGRAIKLVKLVLPLLVATAAVVVKLRAGQLGVPLSLALLGGALLGWSVALVLEGTAALFGDAPRGRGPGERTLRQLARDRQRVLRAIKDLDLDARIQQLPPAESAALLEPLRERAARLLQEIDRERLEQPGGIDGQIEAELARRGETR